MNGLEKEIEAVVLTGRRLAARGHIVGAGGNLSLRVRMRRPTSDPALALLGAAVPLLAGADFLVTRSGARLDSLDPERDLGIVRILPDGDRAECWFDGENTRPTLEIDTHLAVHAALVAGRSDAVLVVHAHPRALIALTHIEECRGEQAISRAILGAHPEGAAHLAGGIGWVDYRTSGGPSIARDTAEAVARGNVAVVWDRHGVIAHGRTVLGTTDRVDLIDFAAEVQLRVLATGRPHSGISEEEIASIRETFGPRTH